MKNSALGNAVELVARLLLVSIFVLAGLNKLQDQAGTIAYMGMGGVPAFLYWPTVALELGGGLLILVGFQTRLAALALAAFCIVSAALFHNNLGDQGQFINFFKNVGMTGGFLLLVVNGAGRWSVDGRNSNED